MRGDVSSPGEIWRRQVDFQDDYVDFANTGAQQLGKNANSRVLGDNMEAAGMFRPERAAAHHIVAGTSKQGAAARSMRVSRVTEDVERFQTLVPVDDGVWETDTLIFDGKPKSSWQPPEVVVFNPLEKRGNFFYLTPGALVFDERALEKMDDLFEMAGQVLELPGDGEVLYVLNVLECINALDPSASEWRIDHRSGRRLSLKRHSFRSGFLSESSRFKIPETVRAEVLAYSGVKDSEDEFMGRYLSSNLEGLKFEELWRE